MIELFVNEVKDKSASRMSTAANKGILKNRLNHWSFLICSTHGFDFFKTNLFLATPQQA